MDQRVDDTLSRKRGLKIFGTGMHHDPLISSRARPHVSWGHDWVILSLLIPAPPWSPTKVWALPVAIRSVSVSRPSLDDVFMSYTGKTIRDAEASVVDRNRMIATRFGRRQR